MKKKRLDNFLINGIIVSESKNLKPKNIVSQYYI